MLSHTLKEQYSLFSVGMGAMPFSLSNRCSEEEAIGVIETFLALGGNFIDTADVYGLNEADRGHNEKLICKALKKYGGSNVLVATKGGATRPNGGWGLRGGHPKRLRQVCEQSLLNLNLTEHSLYYLHGPDPAIPLEDSLGELIKLQAEGKIKHIGIANVTFEELMLAIKLTTITAVQNRCNPFCKGDLRNGLIDFCKRNNIIYVSYCPLGGWTEHRKLAASFLYKQLQAIQHASSYLISLSWLLTKGEHIIPIPGMDKKNQVMMNVSASKLKLTADDMTKLDAFPDLYSPTYLDK